MMDRRRKLAVRLVCAIVAAFAASMILTWILHDRITTREMLKLSDELFHDIGASIRERVDRRMIRQAMVAREAVYGMRGKEWWKDPDESSRRLRKLADELGVNEVCVANAAGMLTHSARREEVGALDFHKDKGQAHEFVALLEGATEFAQPIQRNSLRGEMVKYVGVWIPDGGFIQIGGREKSVRNLSRTAITGLTHYLHVGGHDGGVYITTAGGTIISHPEPGREGGQWTEPSSEYYWAKRVIEGFPVYVVIPKRTAISNRRVLVASSALPNCVALVFAAILAGIVIARYVRERIRERNAADMAMAANIQESAIPRVFPPFHDETRMDIFGMMHTARDVGGDFYDFYFTRTGVLMFLMADVSGKGVPAALFMMRAKATIKGIAQTGLPLDEVATRVNDALSHDNDASMFVTAWIGEIDLSTGVMKYVNAGHNPPLFVEKARLARHEKPRFLRERSGMMLGAMPGLKYRAQTLRLAPGDIVYLYTDGLTEQTDAKCEMFGEERLAFSLGEMLYTGVKPFDGGSSPLLGALFGAVVAHGAGVEQFDDCTQLVFRYNGSRTLRSFPPSKAGLAAASEWLDGVVEASPGDMASLHIMLDEICSNIVLYSGATGFDVEIESADELRRIKMTFSDDGVAYDPLSHADPDITLGVKERPIGGLGIMMVKKMAASVSYSREGGRNRLAVQYSLVH